MTPPRTSVAIVDPDARIFERWTPAGERPTILADTITWQPAGASQAFTLDIRQFFEEVDRKAGAKRRI